MSSIIGAAVTLGIGVIIIAGIYQLGQSSNPVAADVTGAYTTTVTTLFK